MEILDFTIKFSKITAKRRKNEKPFLQNKAHQTKSFHGNELYATSLRLRALIRKKEQSSEVEPGGKSNASTIKSIFLLSKIGIIAEELLFIYCTVHHMWLKFREVW